MLDLSTLNTEQRKAVELIDGPVSIIAGAGSGKTRVITCRIAHMLDRGIPESAILALTFTNKAAREMAHRAAEITGRKLTRLTISTFHAFGVKILREHIERLGFRPNFSIYDTGDQLALVKEAARESKYSLDGVELRGLGTLFSNIKTGRTDWTREDAAFKPLFHEYCTGLKLYNAVDFDDLIMLPIALFRDFPDVLEQYRARYRYIMVDEFQDTSTNQYAVMKNLAETNKNVCVVGDDDQSIYSWRGADFRNLLQFETDFPERLEVKLERNYRSTDTILAAANGVIAHNTNRKDKALWTHTTGGRPIQLYHPEDEAHEAAFIAQTIKSLALEENLKYHDVGVLIRTNGLSRSIEENFLAERIPYRMAGGESFFQRQEVKDMISYLRVIANHDDDVALMRVLNTPRRGIGRKALETATTIARERNCTLYSAITMICTASDSPASDRMKSDLASFVELIEKYRPLVLSGRKMADGLRALVDEIDYWAHLVADNPKNDKAPKWKFRNVQFFAESLENFARDPDAIDPTLFDYLNRITLQTRDDDDQNDTNGKVNLMTIHAAKGLEFDVVFLAGVEDGIVPHARALEEAPENVEEERRLFYVALTRAKQKLFISSCRRRNVMRETIECTPSPFLEEIPADLITYHEGETTIDPVVSTDYFSLVRNRLAAGNAG